MILSTLTPKTEVTSLQMRLKSRRQYVPVQIDDKKNDSFKMISMEGKCLPHIVGPFLLKS